MKDRSPQGAQVATTTTLDSEEEKVVRMRQGLGAPDEMALPSKAEGFPDVAAQLRQMELRALEMSGRLQELRQEVGLDAEENAGVKDKIISRLSEK